ncbi:hypothetical protein FCIRC_297 [Fusarium circinatum]|uniref:ubiquitinyl hydrolase 1 n=1 Tax=Fusarium circinatum TaxID=48490 RepID=A0A8H5XDP3_FUSCI|nr:hypothetical protein FCIRC_297 [Fusarium circinatum]
MSATLEPKLLLQAVFHHVVLPSKLPSRNDADNSGLAYDLGSRLQRALAKFNNDHDQDAWNVLVASMKATAFLNQGQLISHELLERFQGIASGEKNIWLALFVTQQNSALLVHRNDIEETVIFEAFQTDAPVKDVLAAKHCLTWEFPHRSVQVPFNVFNDSSFLRNLSQFLGQASYESFDQFAAKASKGGKSIAETRNSTDPALVIDMLMSLLEGLGSGAQVQSVRKKVRDDVVLGSSEVPWRRSPYWLVLRVALRRMLRELLDYKCAGMGRVYYKFIICVMLAELLKDSVDNLHPEMTLQLRAKLCRRVAKLKTDSAACSSSLRPLYDRLFALTSGDLGEIVKHATERVSRQWDDFKARVTRRIPTLPCSVPEADLYIRLDNSGAFLRSQLSQRLTPASRIISPDLPKLQEGTILEVGRLADRYISLQDLENAAAMRIATTSDNPQELCKSLSTGIMDLLTNVGDSFNNDSTLMSRHLLRLFELWIKMDEAATYACPLLKEYHPLFIPDALDVLCLMTRGEMERLLRVQQYIRNRVASHKKGLGTIFDNPRQGSTFPAKYVSSTAAGSQMLMTATLIDDASLKARRSTLSELERLTQRYDSLTQSLNDLACTCTVSSTGKKITHGCRRCPKFWQRKKLKISVHEDFLPSTDTDQRNAQRAAILVELLIPQYLSAYRTATWQLYLLGTTIRSSTKAVPKLLLEDITDIKKFSLVVNKTFTLASRKKSFKKTHYGNLKLPKTPEQVTFRFGAEMSYYDTVSGLWADELPKIPWYQHLLGPWLPGGILDPYETPRGVLGMLLHHPSSYEIIASELMCPQALSGNDFCAFQRAVSARGRRWFEILKELAASNFDFSSRATNSFFHRLAMQAGPAALEEGILREVHLVFSSESFYYRLKERLEAWMDAMEQNWRQVDRMSTVVIFGLRLYQLGPPSFEMQAHQLLLRVRSITSNWILQLQHEVRSTLDGDMASKAATFAFWSALLCRQTFWGCLGHDDFEATLLKDDPLPFFRSSIALQENLLDSSDKLPTHLRSLLAQDMSASYQMRSIVEKWVDSNVGLVEKAINETWADASVLAQRSYSPWKKLPGKHSWWISSQTAPSDSVASQRVHYHILQGHLLVDQKPLGRLPLEIRDDESMRELFEERHLLTRPSGLLDYQVLTEMEGHQIHVGIRDGEITIKALFRGSILRFVPRSTLKGPMGWDLPADLVDDCVHWLDLTTGNLEMRRKPRIWRRKLSNWILDIRKRRATRKPGTSLVEPNSEIGRKVGGVFQDFEDFKRLTIYQPANGDLSVELKRLELRFHVNQRGLFYCPQLKAEVDPQQDIGTLHGLQSGVTLRNTSNPERKSVIMPIGGFQWQREGIHVAVRISNEGVYAKYTLNSVLGRLDCPPEPLLLYLKAAIHALTSFPLPDDFTGKTGTEEARHCLLSRISQPWTPLAGFPQRILSVIKSLSPERTLYPPGINLYQKVRWDEHLTSTIQHEDLAPLVTLIENRSRELETFSNTETMIKGQHESVSYDASVARLRIRGRIRRQLYERVCFDSDSTVLSQAAQTDDFVPLRDQKLSVKSCRVYQTIRAMMESDTGAFHLPKLAPILEKWNTFRDVAKSTSFKTRVRIKTWQKLYPELRRLKSNWELSVYLLDLENAADLLLDNQSKMEEKTYQDVWISKPTPLKSRNPEGSREYLMAQLLVPHAFVNRIVDYGVLATRLQRYLRIEDAILRRDDRWLEENSETEGHSNWNPLKYPEWLLLEIDSNMLIRPIQFEVANAIISPSSMSNSVLQMNMGQGKTSCIMPMASIMLANTKNLCRLVVPRALLLQTAQVMQSRLGGLVGREVCHLPFARRSPTDDQALDLYHSLHKRTLASGGVMLCLPEHLLSFKLSGLQKLADKETKKAQKMMNIQAWLESSSRDVLDESDLTLSPKTQLIYPSGIPTMIDGHPQRWRLIEDMLSLVESHVPQLQAKFKDGIEVWRRHRGFPVIHLLRPEVEDRLNALLVDDVCHGRLSYVQFKADKSLTATKSVKLLLSTTQPPASIWEDAIASLNDGASGRKTLYLLHGLIPQRLLILCLKKSWNVQYGLHPDRAPIAVPFEAKGIPSQTAEYGHPDTALVLTCLSFYHAGLSKSQLLQSLQLISNSEDPSSHYQRFASSRHLPENLEHWHQLEMEDEAQVTLLWQYLRFEKHVVNHFLNNFAFPQHAKQFGVKFQASAWDIPLLSESMKRQGMTTGFSGTNDNKKILPRTIRQDDLPTLIQTNAEVLVHLLEPRNQKCFQAVDRHGRHLNEIGILELLRNNGIRILIDAGAQILEMENHQLAAAWLDVYTEAQGAVYFDKNGRIMVRARFQKSPVPLLASSFADTLEKCVVYIDEAHTRGTDLKLPLYAQGAVTLGISSTKDQITQAAMRLRQLATTQSIAFVAPPEVYTSVLSLRSAHSPRVASSQPLKSTDIVHWLLEQSCQASDNMMSLHIAQGFDFCRRTNALLEFRKSSQNKKKRDKLLQETQQPEGQTLEQLYGPKEKTSSTGLRVINSTHLQRFMKELHGLEADLVKSQRRACSSAFDEVEQEREVEFEVHQLREKQNPTHLTALTFSGLDKALVQFCDESEVELASLHFISVLDLIGDTYIGLKYGVKGSSLNLFVSKEFSRTVETRKAEVSRRLMRPVEWVLWRPDIQTALVVIPEEAELLLPILRRIRTPTTFLLTYTSPFTRSLLDVGTLAYFPVPTPKKGLVIPSWLSIEIGIMAGRLYLPYDQYTQLRSCLNADERAEHLASMDDAHRSRKHILPNFGILSPQSLSKFLSEWISYRSQSSDITHTPMGYLTGNRDLPDNHPFFTSQLKSRAIETRSAANRGAPMKNVEVQSSDDESE